LDESDGYKWLPSGRKRHRKGQIINYLGVSTIVVFEDKVLSKVFGHKEEKLT
jgi:hypothetical protein